MAEEEACIPKGEHEPFCQGPILTSLTHAASSSRLYPLFHRLQLNGHICDAMAEALFINLHDCIPRIHVPHQCRMRSKSTWAVHGLFSAEL